MHSEEPVVAGLLWNTPAQVCGLHLPVRMAEVAAETIGRCRESAAAELGLRIMHDLQALLLPIREQPCAADEFDAMWDFGGCAAFVVGGSAALAVARVGNLRVLSVSDNTVSELLHEHTLRVSQSGTEPQTVVVACLAAMTLPADVVTLCPLSTQWIVIAPYEVLDRIPPKLIVGILNKDTASSAKAMLDAALQEQRKQNVLPRSCSLLVVRVLPGALD